MITLSNIRKYLRLNIYVIKNFILFYSSRDEYYKEQKEKDV